MESAKKHILNETMKIQVYLKEKRKLDRYIHESKKNIDYYENIIYENCDHFFVLDHSNGAYEYDYICEKCNLYKK